MRGYTQTLEALISAIIILTAMVYLFIPKQVSAETNLYQTGYNCLKDLDNKGLLRYYSLNDPDELKNSLESCLPKIINFDLKVCTDVSCKSNAPSGKEITLTTYLISGDGVLEPRIIKLWMWQE